MTVEQRREQERARVREALIDAGRAMFVSRPYDEVTLRAVAKKAGYSAPTILNHFGSKEGLIFAICELDYGALRARFERIAKVADPVERLRKLGMAYVEFAMENPHHYRFMFMSEHPIPDPGQYPIDRNNPDQDAYAFFRATVAEAIAAGRFRDEYDDPDMIAQVLWSGGHGLVSLHLTKGNDPCLPFRPVKATADVLTDATLRGLLKEEE
ncbi:MAG: TetR/AcrR family transcriptional regulator [Isosphaeraceae bacterium]|nr:TetR/AcrR family transcriptional regulator [Isosphaeraceae bacterium]